MLVGVTGDPAERSQPCRTQEVYLLYNNSPAGQAEWGNGSRNDVGA